METQKSIKSLLFQFGLLEPCSLVTSCMILLGLCIFMVFPSFNFNNCDIVTNQIDNGANLCGFPLRQFILDFARNLGVFTLIYAQVVNFYICQQIISLDTNQGQYDPIQEEIKYLKKHLNIFFYSLLADVFMLLLHKYLSTIFELQPDIFWNNIISALLFHTACFAAAYQCYMEIITVSQLTPNLEEEE